MRIQVIDLYQPKLQFHLHLHNKELEIQLHSLLVGQGAMSHLLIQMAQEMSRRTGGQGAGDPSQSSGQGSNSGGRKEMKMDEKWIPWMPIASLEELDHREERNYQDSRVGWSSFQVGYA